MHQVGNLVMADTDTLEAAAADEVSTTSYGYVAPIKISWFSTFELEED